MKFDPSALPCALGVAVSLAMAGCGGGSGADKPTTASAQVSPVSDPASAVVSVAAAEAAQAASMPASAASGAASEAVPSAKIAATTSATDAVRSTATPTTSTTSATTSTTATSGTTTTTAGSTSTGSKTAGAVTLATITAPPAASISAPMTGAATETTTAATTAVYTGPTRYSPLWTAAADETALKSGGLTGMALLTSVSTNIFKGARVAKEDWPTLVSRYKNDPDVANWVQKTEQARVDAWMARNFERADLIGGWVYNYIDPKTNLLRSWSPTDAEPAAGTTETEKKFKGAWVAWGRQYNIAQAQAAARIYRATGLTKYADWAAKQLDFYATQYGKWPVSTAEGRSTMYMQGLDEASDAFALVDTARLLESYAGAARTATWKNQLFMPMAANLKSTSAPKSNIQLWHASAIAAIAMRYKDATLLDYAINDVAGIKSNMNAGLTSDNLWIEGTFSYNTYVIECLSKLLVAAGIEGYADRFTAEADGALRMLLAPMEYRFDDGSLPNPGDSTGAQVVVNDAVHWYLYRTMPTYWGVAKATAWRTWESLLDAPTANKTTTPPPIPTATTKNFNSLRWSVLRAGNWQAFVRYGGMLANHWADESFNFELRHGTTAIAVDPGTVTYGSPYHQGYFQRGVAGNVPLVDGDNQSKWAPGTLTSFDLANATVSAEQPLFQADASVGRTFRVTTGGLVEQAVIKVPSGKTKRLGMVFSSSCDIVPGTGVSSATGQPALPAVTAFGYWTNTATYTTTSNWRVTLKCAGNKNYVMQVWGPGTQRLYIGKAPNTPMPSTRNSIYYEVSGAKAVFESSITAQ